MIMSCGLDEKDGSLSDLDVNSDLGIDRLISFSKDGEMPSLVDEPVQLYTNNMLPKATDPPARVILSSPDHLVGSVPSLL